MPTSISPVALLVGALCLACAVSPAHAFKRRPNGCDWIGGDFAEPGEIIFNTGCKGGRGARHAGAPAQPRDEPPKLLDRLDARAPPDYGASTRKAIGAGIERFEIVGDKLAYGLDGTGRLWRFALGGKDSTMVAQSVSRFRAAGAGPLFVLEKDGTLWRSDGDGSNRAFLDHQASDVQPTSDTVYVLATDKKLSRLHADGKGRDSVDENVAAFQAMDSKIVFVLGTDGTLWRENGDARDRVKIGKPVAAFEHVADGDTTYVLTPDHLLWRQSGTASPRQVDRDVAAFHAVDANLAYVLATDARLWREPGDRSRAALVDGDLAVKLGAAAFQFAGKGDAGAEAVYVLDRKHSLWAEAMPVASGGGEP